LARINAANAGDNWTIRCPAEDVKAEVKVLTQWEKQSEQCADQRSAADTGEAARRRLGSGPGIRQGAKRLSKRAWAMQLPFHILDVFTDTPFTGNGLAVVLDADGLDGTRMQAIAREFNLSETVFVLNPQQAAHTARVRIFTPAREMPFAGHPTVGTAALLAELKASAAQADGDALVVLEEPIGIVRVGVRLRAGAAPYAEFDAPKLPEDGGTAPPTDELAAALGLIPSEIGFENHRPSMYSAGNSFVFVPVASLEAIGKAQVAPQHWATAMRRQGHTGAFLYCRQTVHTTSAFHARMFAPDSGVPEDPATGSAAAAFAGVVHRFDALPDGGHKRSLEQGYEMGRPSLIELSLQVEGGNLAAVRIGGHAVRIAEGRIEA
jgi:trans-2,3-dihydro-3-hydroxyanthranilate isomerase